MSTMATLLGPRLEVIRDDVLATDAYHVPPATGLIKLDAMENPFRLPTGLADALGRSLGQVALNRYPPAHPVEFKTKLAAAIELPSELELMLGNGSDELIHLVIQACAKPNATIVSPWPSFVMYAISARHDGCRFVGVPLKPDFSLDSPAMLEAIKTHRPAVVFLSYPNNPTGNLFDRAAIDAILDVAPGVVVVDEAYLPFAQATYLDELLRRPGLVVLRTLSKLGLAGIRLGYLCGDPAWIRQFDKLRPPYNVNVLTLAAAEFMLDHLPLLDQQAAMLRSERARVAAGLAKAGVEPFESAANFILFRVRDPDAVFGALKAQGVLIKNVAGAHPLLAGCLRTTIGTAEENDAFLAALDVALAAG